MVILTPRRSTEAARSSIADFLEEIINMAKGVYQTWFDSGWGQQLDLENSWLRLHLPNGIKVGGGARVHQITYGDRWNAATGGVEPDALTGHVYEYRLADGSSSGVASYEPSEGADENAVRDAKPFTQKVLLSSDYRLFSELPALEAYYPAPIVGYSRVTERSLASEQARDKARAGNVPTRTSTVGPTVYEYYTARDFPVQTNETAIVKKRNPEPNMVPIPFLGMITLKSLVASQGYSVVLNDMHGKLRSVTHYEYGQAWDATKQDFMTRDMPTDSTQFSYRTTGGGEGGQSMKLKDTLPVLEADAGRAQTDPGFAKEAELFLDTRRNRTESWEVGLNVNVDLTEVIYPIPIIVPVPSFSYSLSEAKTVVAAKVVHQSGVLDKVVQTMGPTHTTRSNLLFDPMSGRALLSAATNSFGDPVYSYQLPARWMYPRMDAAFSSSGLKLPLTGAQLTDSFTLQIAQPAIPACADDPGSPPTTSACLPLGSRFAAVAGTAVTTLVLTAADPTEGLSLKSPRPMPAAPTGDATLIQSGNRNELDEDAGTIQALQDPTVNRGQGKCAGGTGFTGVHDTGFGSGNDFSPPQTIDGVLSASARVFNDGWDSIKDDMWFSGSATNITQQRTAYDARDDFTSGRRGAWRPAVDFVYVEKRGQAAGVNTRTDGTFLLQMFDWKNQKYFPFCEPKWEIKSTVTRYTPSNAPSEELNAVRIPTSALYAFGRSVPVALGDNAFHDEIAFESFESFPRNTPVQIEQTGEGNYVFQTLTHRYRNPAPQCPIAVKTPAIWLRDVLKINERNLPAFVQGLPEPGVPPEPTGDPFALQGVTAEIAGEACAVPVTSVRAIGKGEYDFAVDTAHPVCGSPERVAGQPAARRRSSPTTMQSPKLVGRPVMVTINFDCRQRHPTYTTRKINLSTVKAHTGTQSLRVELNEDFMQVKLRPRSARTYIVSAWVSRDDTDVPTFDTGDLGIQIKYWQNGQEMTAQRPALFVPGGPIIAEWQRVEGQFQVPADADSISIALQYGTGFAPGAYFDDIRVEPLDARLETFVYDPATMRIGAKLDNNNLATFYSYQADGSLQQTQRETPQGLLTSAEGRTHFQERP